MTEDTYSYILRVLKTNYSTSNGIVGQLKVSTSRFPWSLCMSTIRNEGKLIPDSCVLWDGEKLLYAGKINSKKLKRIIMSSDPCRLEITTAKDMENGPGDYICLKHECECSGKCPCKAENYWKDLLERRPELNKETIEMKQPEFKSHILDAWKAGMKEGKKTIKNGNIFNRNRLQQGGV